MKFQTGKNLLEQAMARIETIVPARDTQTLLSNVLVGIEDSEVSITASDMESTVRISIEAQDTEAGELILPAKKLGEVARQLRAESVTFTATKTESDQEGFEPYYEVKLLGNDARSARFKMTGGDRSHFPGLAHIEENRLNQLSSEILDDMIRKTFYAISQEDNRYIYNGLCFQAEGNKLTIIGTDGRRLAAITREMPQPLALGDEDTGDIVVHAKAIRELQRIIDSAVDLYFGVQQRDIFFRVGNAELSSRLLEGKFPDYKKVIPAELSIEIDLSRQELLDALTQVKVMTETPSFQVRLTLESGQMIMRANTPEVGEAEIQLPVEYQAEPLEIGFNTNYLIEILRALQCDTVRLGFIDSAKPIVVKDTDDPDFLALVMPMKI